MANPQKRKKYFLGCDVGGTFTDLLLIDSTTSAISAKVSTDCGGILKNVSNHVQSIMVPVFHVYDVGQSPFYTA